MTVAQVRCRDSNSTIHRATEVYGTEVKELCTFRFGIGHCHSSLVPHLASRNCHSLALSHHSRRHYEPRPIRGYQHIQPRQSATSMGVSVSSRVARELYSNLPLLASGSTHSLLRPLIDLMVPFLRCPHPKGSFLLFGAVYTGVHRGVAFLKSRARFF